VVCVTSRDLTLRDRVGSHGHVTYPNPSRATLHSRSRDPGHVIQRWVCVTSTLKNYFFLSFCTAESRDSSRD
jgi:hypothetical protein